MCENIVFRSALLLRRPIFLRRPQTMQIFCVLLFWITSCASQPQTESWRRQYSHLGHPVAENRIFTESDYYIVFLVAARHLDYHDNVELFKTIARYESSFKKGEVGHSWVYLKGIRDGKTVTIEGGHSARLGKRQPRFYDGVMNYIQYGYANPTDSQKNNPRYEPNPIRYLWAELDVGLFQKGSGGLVPTYAAKVDLSREQFDKIISFVDQKKYPYQRFSLVGNQCSSFLARIAAMVGFPLEHAVTIQLESVLKVGIREYRLWTDPRYSTITFSSPDVIERSLMKAVAEERAEYARTWYLNKHRPHNEEEGL